MSYVFDEGLARGLRVTGADAAVRRFGLDISGDVLELQAAIDGSYFEMAVNAFDVDGAVGRSRVDIGLDGKRNRIADTAAVVSSMVDGLDAHGVARAFNIDLDILQIFFVLGGLLRLDADAVFVPRLDGDAAVVVLD